MTQNTNPGWYQSSVQAHLIVDVASQYNIHPERRTRIFLGIFYEKSEPCKL